MRSFLNQADRLFTYGLKFMIISFFVTATLLYIFQMTIRVTFVESVFWIDLMINYLFTLAALAGAALSVRTQESIKIDLLKKYKDLKKIKITNLVFSLIVSMSIFLVFIGHFKEEWIRNELEYSLIPRWSLDLPYLFLFLGSTFYFFNHLVQAISSSSASFFNQDAG